MNVVSVGYPDYWDRGWSLDPVLFQRLPEIVPLIDAVLRTSETEPLGKAVRAITRMVCHTFSGVTILAMNGHGHDCLRLTRSMLEGAATAAYLTKYPDELSDYLEYAKISAMRMLDYSLKYPTSSKAVYSDAQAKKIIADYEGVAPRFTRASGQPRAHWCRKQIRQMFAEVNLESYYLSVYHVGSAAVHMNARGLIMTYHLDENLDVMNYVPPDNDWIKLSLDVARVSSMVALEAFGRASVDGDTDQLVGRILALLST